MRHINDYRKDYDAAKAEFATILAEANLSPVTEYDEEWWSSFMMDFFSHDFGIVGTIDEVRYACHQREGLEWVNLIYGPHRVLLAYHNFTIDDGMATDGEYETLLTYASSPEALTAIQEKAGHPGFAWIEQPDEALP